MKRIWKYFFLLLPTFTSAQNLVPNPSFEIFDTCPAMTDQVSFATGWSSFGNSPDYFNTCAPTSSNVSVPQNIVGYQVAASGNAYCGLQTYTLSDGFNYREYIGAQLADTLKINHKYFISFKTNIADLSAFNCGVNKIGVRFSMIAYSTNYLPVLNNFANVYSNNIISDTLNWTTVSGSFIADSNYKYIIIGNFFDNAHTDTLNCITTLNSYSYIDDVCVSLDSATCNTIMESIEERASDDNFTIFPNPPVGFINVTGKEIQDIQLINVLGIVCISKSANGFSFVNMNVSSFARGIYFLKINTQSKTIMKQIILN